MSGMAKTAGLFAASPIMPEKLVLQAQSLKGNPGT